MHDLENAKCDPTVFLNLDLVQIHLRSFKECVSVLESNSRTAKEIREKGGSSLKQAVYCLKEIAEYYDMEL